MLAAQEEAKLNTLVHKTLGDGQSYGSDRDDVLCKFGLTQDLYTVHKEEYPIACYMCRTYT
jgi:hypothetical protein